MIIALSRHSPVEREESQVSAQQGSLTEAGCS